jgi:serine/threonine protein kinase
MRLPIIDAAGVAALLPSASEIVELDRGGQKLVFRAKIGAENFALKFLLVGGEDAEEGDLATVRARADREVAIMRDCDSPNMVKLGPIGLEVRSYNGQNILLFSEELISGSSLKDVIALQTIDAQSTIDLGLQIGSAIVSLWNIGKVHRDIKPGNIMRRNDGTFVLLDAGLAFDIGAESLSVGLIVGTFIYLSPEQFDYSSRRSLDFRSDQFALGVTMYQACTGVHPFYSAGMTQSRVFSGILSHHPPPPSSINPVIPAELDDIILRTLGKSPHLRFRKMEQFLAALKSLKG